MLERVHEMQAVECGRVRSVMERYAECLRSGNWLPRTLPGRVRSEGHRHGGSRTAPVMARRAGRAIRDHCFRSFARVTPRIAEERA